LESKPAAAVSASVQRTENRITGSTPEYEPSASTSERALDDSSTHCHHPKSERGRKKKSTKARVDYDDVGMEDNNGAGAQQRKANKRKRADDMVSTACKIWII